MKESTIIQGKCLDFVEAVHHNRAYPLMSCHMELFGHLDPERLKRAVSQSSEIVPEILCVYDFQTGSFASAGYTADDVIRYAVEQPVSSLRQDLSIQPQLRILISPNGAQEFVTVIMSHILADGAGFLQYLYLLASLYHSGLPDPCIQNVRDIFPLLENIRVLASTEQTRHHKHLVVPPLRTPRGGNRSFCLTTQISANDLGLIHQKAKLCGATLNEVFMVAYARVIARMQNINTVVLPCPADLRRFDPEWHALTVANMTGIYQRVPIEVSPEGSFTEILQQVHIEMQLQRSRRRCFAGIKALNRAFNHVPPSLLRPAVKATYRLLPVSYTNFGRIDHERLWFEGCTIKSCFITGAYRLPPDFQLTISTFKNRCTLNCALIGNAHDGNTGQYILDQVKCELFKWIENR